MEYRSFYFVNMYVKSIAAGIQSGHSAEEMWSYYTEKYFDGTITPVDMTAFNMLRVFAKDHKTWILLNGGDHDVLYDLYSFLVDEKNENPYPVSIFREPGLNNAITAVRIILPERMFDKVALKLGTMLLATPWKAFKNDQTYREMAERNYTDFELELLKRKAMCGLAS